MKTIEPNVLIIDNDQVSIRCLLGILARKGIRGLVVETHKDALECLDRDAPDVVFSSVRYDKSAEDLHFVDTIKAQFPELPVVTIGDSLSETGQASQQLADLAVRAAHMGCRHFLVRPLNPERVEELLESLLPNRSVNQAGADFIPSGDYRIVGRSPQLMQTINLAAKVASTTMPILISGECGSGKELIASLIHYNSQRANGPYIQVNCAALNETLLESELFGHEKGAFTGAYAQRKGRFEMAHGGTLLLDEITETPLKFQAALLRALEQQDFERVGGNNSVCVDVRMVSTTNRNLAEEVAAGRFRQDLYYRLCGLRLIVPPLRERTEDLEDLIWHFVNLYSRQTNRHIQKICGEMLEIFKNYHWPGNIRQLRNVVRTSLVLGTGSTLSLADATWLCDEVQPRIQKTSRLRDNKTGESISDLGGLSLADVERYAILDTLEQTAGNQTKAAKILGISDRTLRGKIRQYRQQEHLQPA